ncbi:MAG: type II toxin-antitoxin system VapC family toxin [Candidatus Limnocylindrales bacterium]
MTIVVDASAVVAALVDGGSAGAWAASELGGGPLAAPHLMPVEAANILRRAVLTGDVSADTAALAHDDLVQLRVELFPYEPFAPRVWELRANLTAYDAWYVALAEVLGGPLVTLDLRLARAPGPRCDFRLPPPG